MSIEVIKFTGDTKLFRLTKSREGNKKLQKKINKLGEWSTWWQIKFSVDICKLMYFTRIFFIYFYTLVSSKLIVWKGKDLDSIVKSAIKSSAWHAAIVESFGTGRRNNMKNSLMSLNQLSSAFQTPCTIPVTNCKQKFCEIRSSSVLSGKDDRG